MIVKKHCVCMGDGVVSDRSDYTNHWTGQYNAELKLNTLVLNAVVAMCDIELLCDRPP